jgi:hypothetical protein
MGKVEDMRRQREERHAQNERDARARSIPALAGPGQVAATPAAKTGADRDAAIASETGAETAEDELAAAVAAAFVPRSEAGAGSSSRTSSTQRPSRDAHGACSVCGKQRPMHNQLISVHQKGLGKVCPGSRKSPA